MSIFWRKFSFLWIDIILPRIGKVAYGIVCAAVYGEDVLNIGAEYDYGIM